MENLTHSRHALPCLYKTVSTNQVLLARNFFLYTFSLICILLTYSFSIPAIAAESVNQDQIHIEITTHMGDEQTFVEGDTLSFFLNLDRDANVMVLYEDASGTLVQILPNDYSTQTLYRAGFFIQVPTGMLRRHFVVAPPFGKERIFAFASTERFPLLPGQALDNGLKRIDMPAPAATQLIRDFVRQSHKAYGETKLEITTVRK